VAGRPIGPGADITRLFDAGDSDPQVVIVGQGGLDEVLESLVLNTLHHGRSASELVEAAEGASRKASGEATGGIWKFGPTAQLANRIVMSGKRKAVRSAVDVNENRMTSGYLMSFNLALNT